MFRKRNFTIGNLFILSAYFILTNLLIQGKQIIYQKIFCMPVKYVYVKKITLSMLKATSGPSVKYLTNSIHNIINKNCGVVITY